MNNCYIAAAVRTAVVPRNGAFAKIESYDLAAPLFHRLLELSLLDTGSIECVIMGNALYGGGNPARVAALLAGLSPSMPALSLDSQCCSGMDAVILGAERIQSGKCHVVIAGGMESWSRSPHRLKRPLSAGEKPSAYERPPFTPWPDRDPDMLQSAAALAEDRNIGRRLQEAFAIESHRRAVCVQGRQSAEIVPIHGVKKDHFTRALSNALCQRLPRLAGAGDTALTSATVAVEADAAAAVLLVSESVVATLPAQLRALRIVDALPAGGDPLMPSLAPVAACRRLLERQGLNVADICLAEVMEAFAVQAMCCIEDIGFDPELTNAGGGALSRGHPVGASGTVNVVRLWHEMQTRTAGSLGMATIAAAGGLASALLGEVI